ncbi:MAG: hypothetical protein NZM04_08075 [Methylacidiphilales bacterium]|nr:hypothetical protein [Candidatus Methylacidiphilales bacterium]
MKFKLLILAGCFIFSSCIKNAPPINPDDVVGTYVGEYGKEKEWKEVIIIKPDGSYQQLVYQSGEQLYDNQGKWKALYQGVEFSDFIVLMRGFGEVGYPEKTAFFSAVWSNYQSRKCLAFDIDNDYVACERK